jgi:hypothetical protein
MGWLRRRGQVADGGVVDGTQESRGRFRTAVLTLDRSSALPLTYEYDGQAGCFRTLGYVRVGATMVLDVIHAGPDTTIERDRFLMKVLSALTLPDGRARRIVSAALHPS